jgi:hypothetical protein
MKWVAMTTARVIKLINEEEDKEHCDSSESAEERRKEDGELLNDLVPGVSYTEDNIEMSEEIETIDVNSLVGEYRAHTKEWCGFVLFTFDTAPFFCVCPVYSVNRLCS